MDVSRVAQLANLKVEKKQSQKLQDQFESTVATVATIGQLDTSGIEPTSQVTGLENVTREDVVDQSRILPHDLVMRSAKHTHNGYFVVPAVFDQ
jgi:aspartyl-tRNA(Asn)/glutamyl-tRNA(Gln) amidotransferase subunit C